MAQRDALPRRGTIIVDGYNLLRRGFGFPGRNLAAQREALEVQLRVAARRLPGVKIVLIYDGAAGVVPPFQTTGIERVSDQIETVFSRPPATADDLVLEECARRAAATPVLVVTSDRKDIVRRLPSGRVAHLESEEFVARLEELVARRHERPSGSDPNAAGATEADVEEVKTNEQTPGEIDAWLRIFAEATASDPPSDVVAGRGVERTTAAAESSASGDEPEDEPVIGKPPAPTAAEVDEWLRLFGEDGGES